MDYCGSSPSPWQPLKTHQSTEREHVINSKTVHAFAICLRPRDQPSPLFHFLPLQFFVYFSLLWGAVLKTNEIIQLLGKRLILSKSL